MASLWLRQWMTCPRARHAPERPRRDHEADKKSRAARHTGAACASCSRGVAGFPHVSRLFRSKNNARLFTRVASVVPAAATSDRMPTSQPAVPERTPAEVRSIIRLASKCPAQACRSQLCSHVCDMYNVHVVVLDSRRLKRAGERPHRLKSMLRRFPSNPRVRDGDVGCEIRRPITCSGGLHLSLTSCGLRHAAPARLPCLPPIRIQ